MSGLEDLPSELVDVILRELEESGCPASCLAFARVSRSLRGAVSGSHYLKLPKGSLLQWNEFAASPYYRIGGEGFLSMPRGGLEVASRRIRRSLHLFLREDQRRVPDLMRELLVCLRVRSSLYPQDRFQIRDSQGSLVTWDPSTRYLQIDIDMNEWRKYRADIAVVISHLSEGRGGTSEPLLETFDPDVRYGKGQDPGDLAPVLKDLWPWLSVRSIVFHKHLFELSPRVRKVTIQGFQYNSYLRLTPPENLEELVVKDYWPLNKTWEEQTLRALLTIFSNLHTLTFRVIACPLQPATNTKVTDTLEHLRNIFALSIHLETVRI